MGGSTFSCLNILTEAARKMANGMVVVERTIRAMGRDVQTEIAVVTFFSRALATFSLFRIFLWAPSARGCSRRSFSYGSKAVEQSEAGGDVLEEFRDVVLDGGAVGRGCEQLSIVFRKVDGLDAT